MAETNHGNVYIYGIDMTNPTEAQVTSVSLAKQDEIVLFSKDSNGKRTGVRCDDQTDSIDIGLHVTSSYTRVAVGAKMVVAGGAFAGNYRVVSTSEDANPENWREIKIRAELLEYLTLT